MIGMAKRNLKLFFRDKSAVFFSLLAVFIIIGLYALFLGDVWTGSMEGMPEVRVLEDGTLVQRVPSVSSPVARDDASYVMAMPNYNAYFLQAEARGCGAGGLQETASSESARGMGCFGHLSSFEFPGIEPWDATRTCGECMRREWIATMSPRQWVLDSLRLRLLNCAGRYPLCW